MNLATRLSTSGSGRGAAGPVALDRSVANWSKPQAIGFGRSASRTVWAHGGRFFQAEQPERAAARRLPLCGQSGSPLEGRRVAKDAGRA